jgi:hypothetical protein
MFAGLARAATRPKVCEFVRKHRVDSDRRGTHSDESWMEIFDKRVAVLIDPEGVDPRDYGGKNYDE